MNIVRMTKEFVEKNIDRLMQLIHQIDYQYWEHSHFLKDIPGKWEHSYVSLDDDNPDFITGFIMSSQFDEETIHGHKLFIDPNCHKMGIGRRLFWETIYHAYKMGFKHYTLNVYSESVPAIRLYESFGMKENYRIKDDIGFRICMTGELEDMYNVMKSRML